MTPHPFPYGRRVLQPVFLGLPDRRSSRKKQGPKISGLLFY